MPRSSPARRFGPLFGLVLLAAPAFADGKAAPPSTTTTAAEARKRLDLPALPLAPGGKESLRRLIRLTYTTKSSVETALEFHRKQLHDAGWAEQSDALVGDGLVFTSFTHDGYVVTLSVFETHGETRVALVHLGNVDFGKLPVPEGATVLDAKPTSAAFVLESTPEQVTQFCRDAFLKAGWVPYGDEGNAH